MPKLHLEAAALAVVLAAVVFQDPVLARSRNHRVVLSCEAKTVYVRIFDATGKFLTEVEMATTKEPPPNHVMISGREAVAVDPGDRFVATNRSQGCVQGGDANGPYNEFIMPCLHAVPRKITLDSVPAATFTVTRRIGTLPCKDERVIGEYVPHVTVEELLDIKAVAIEDPDIVGYANGISPRLLPKEGTTGQFSLSRSKEPVRPPALNAKKAPSAFKRFVIKVEPDVEAEAKKTP